MCAFYEVQAEINDAWKQTAKQVDPVRQRKSHLCPKCGKKGFRVKMDYRGNKHVKYQMCVYNFDLWGCPRCGFEFKDWSRIEGKGKRGTNLGKMYGSK